MNVIQPEPVERDEYGAWTHSEVPEFPENVTYDEIGRWAEDRGIYVAIRMMEFDESIDEQPEFYKAYYVEGDPSFARWEPKQLAADHFMLSIHDTESGPCVWWAMPRKQ